MTKNGKVSYFDEITGWIILDDEIQRLKPRVWHDEYEAWVKDYKLESGHAKEGAIEAYRKILEDGIK